MNRGDLRIGSEFKTPVGTWRVTDIGTRTVIAIRIDRAKDESWLVGPPYPVPECVFDEYDLPDCEKTQPVSSEREECALIADRMAADDGATYDQKIALRSVAAKIRGLT